MGTQRPIVREGTPPNCDACGAPAVGETAINLDAESVFTCKRCSGTAFRPFVDPGECPPEIERCEWD